jgi:hypothetical protein
MRASRDGLITVETLLDRSKALVRYGTSNRRLIRIGSLLPSGLHLVHSFA